MSSCYPFMQVGVVPILVSLAVFLASGVCEIGGGWLVWQWRRCGGHWWMLIAGAAVLLGYGLVATLQVRSYARAAP